MDVMFYVVLVAIGYGGYIFGAFSFSQIVGGIRARMYWGSVVLWGALTIVLCGLVYLFLREYFFALAIGLAISLAAVLRTPNIE